jgi:hypothetical protein
MFSGNQIYLGQIFLSKYVRMYILAYIGPNGVVYKLFYLCTYVQVSACGVMGRDIESRQGKRR